MPVHALANDNLLLRQPSVFSDELGNPLSDGTLLLLALARAVVIKEVAEPLRQGSREEQQQVLKGNTIALPQADCRVLATPKLPAELQLWRPWLQQHLSVVFCGSDATDIGRYPKLEVNWKCYVAAVRFLVAHNPDYANVEVDEAAAQVMFGDLGIPAVIKELITGIDAEEGFVQPTGAAVEARQLEVLCVFFAAPNQTRKIDIPIPCYRTNGKDIPRRHDKRLTGENRGGVGRGKDGGDGARCLCCGASSCNGWKPPGFGTEFGGPSGQSGPKIDSSHRQC